MESRWSKCQTPGAGTERKTSARQQSEQAAMTRSKAVRKSRGPPENWQVQPTEETDSCELLQTALVPHHDCASQLCWSPYLSNKKQIIQERREIKIKKAKNTIGFALLQIC